MDAVLITGPTASGKSAFALDLACRYNGAVINADSMQIYDTLRVLTARPAQEDLAAAPHHLYGHVSASHSYSTGEWLRDVAPLLKSLKAEGRLPIFVGGTGLYFKALTGGLSDMPEVDQDIRCAVRLRLKEEGPEALHAELSARDGETAANLMPGDGQRIVRALEILEATGRSIRDFQGKAGPMIVDPAKAAKFVVLPERSVLHSRIDRRFGLMLDGGAIEEVQALMAMRLDDALPVMKAIGVREIAAMLDGAMTRDEVETRGAAATRQYAKRQMTWFRNQMDESWQRINPAA